MLAAEKLVLLAIFLIALIASLYMLSVSGLNPANQLILQSDLKTCCGAYKASGCQNTNFLCSTSTGEMAFMDMQNKLGMSDQNLKCFCGCPDADCS
jgi:hypothetical protein